VAKQICAGVDIEHNSIEVCSHGVICTSEARVNDLDIENNQIRHNYQSGVSVACTVGCVSGNRLEGQRNPLHIGSVGLGDTSWDVTSSGNYFERSTGDYSVMLYRVRRFILDVGWDKLPILDHEDASVQVVGCANGSVGGPALIDGCSNVKHYPTW
jgi:hypothetical protein